MFKKTITTDDHSYYLFRAKTQQNIPLND